jgi:2-polyprenyl-6-methoxyphenol hydroxylase-like FAD-dependent oxidoreductase
MEHQTVSIIGGGIAGLTTALALKKVGIEAHVFEASEQLKPVGAGLGLGANAMKAFKVLGIYDDVVRNGNILPSFSIYDDRGNIITKTTFDKVAEIGSFAIHRAQLHQLLVSQLDPATIHCGKRIRSIENTDFGVKLLFYDGSTHFVNYLIVADGIHSTTRQKLVQTANIRYSGYTCWRAVIDNTQPRIMEPSEIWGAAGRFGIVPLADNRLYWFACVNAAANDPVYKRFRVADLRARFAQYPMAIPEIISQTKDNDLIHNDVADIEPLRQFAFGRIVLIGDAAHATTPNMGQGACQAIEDAIVMAQCLSANADYEKAFVAFEKRRLVRTKWITQTSEKIGRMAQLENRLLISLRNTLLRFLPASASEKQQRRLESVDFINN